MFCLLVAKKKYQTPLVVLNTVQSEGEEVYNEISKNIDNTFSFLAISNLNWNKDMSPYYAEGLKKDEPFLGGAKDYLRELTDSIIPFCISSFNLSPSYIVLSGYSLAGLFAIYALYNTDVFSRVASASGSLWYPKFIDYVRNNEMRIKPDKVSLSLGNKESKTKNVLMKEVENNTLVLRDIFIEKGINTTLFFNEGNHFSNPVGRMAKLIAETLS